MIRFEVPDESVITLTETLDDVTEDVEIRGTAVESLVISGSDGTETILRTDTANVTLVDVRVENGVVEIGDANELGFDTTVDVEVSADLIDSGDAPENGGALVKDGAEELTLRGINSYSGGTRINAGVLRGDTFSLQGDIRNDALLVFDDFGEAGADGTFGGVISGTGAVEKVGTNEVTFSAEHSYNGGTTVREGTLRVSGRLPRTGDVTIDSGAELIVDLPTDVDFALLGKLNGSGTLVKRGINEGMTLRGGGQFTGLVQIEGGSLTDASGALRGDVEFVGSGTPTLDLAFRVDGNQTYSGNISGNGNVIKTGLGTLTLLGINTYTGSTELAGGALIGTSSSIRGDIRVSGFAFGDVKNLLVFDQSFSGSFDGDVDEVSPLFNPLTLEKRGSGTLSLTGRVEASGGTTISGGRLEINGGGVLVSPTVVESGGALGGTSTADPAVFGSVTARGAISPGTGGNGIGSLTLGTVEFQSGSIFEVDVQTDGSGDLLRVFSDADLTGGLVRVLAEPGTYAAGTSISVLRSNTNPFDAGTLTTQFAGFETEYAFLDLDFDYTVPNEVAILIESNANALTDFATTPNQATVAEVLELEEPGTPGSDMEEIFDSIRVIPTEQVEPMLDAIGGEPLSAFPTIQLAVGERLNRAVHRRMRDAVWGGPDALFTVQGMPASPFAVAGLPFSLRPGASGPESALWRQMSFGRSGSARSFQPFEGDTGLGGWLDLWGSLGELDGDGNSADVEYRSFGATLGVDYRLTERISAGLAGGYSRSAIDLAGRASEGDLDLVQGALYAGYVDPRFHVTGSGRYGYGWNDSARRIAFSGIDRTAEARFNSQDFGARAELGTSALRVGPVALAPLAAIDWAKLDREGFRESGAISLDLDVESDALTSLLSSVGGSLRGVFDLGDDVAMMPELRAYWLHEFGDTERLLRARLSGAVNSGSFEITGARVPRDRILAGLGWSASIGEVVRVFADYDVELANGLLAHELALTVRIHF